MLVNDIKKNNFEMTVGRVCDLVKTYTSSSSTTRNKTVTLDIHDKEALWETFKTKSNPEDNPEKINDRIVSL